MAKLIGVKKMNKKMTKLFRKATKSHIKMYLNSDFQYDIGKNTIGYSIIITERADRCWTKFINDCFDLLLTNNFEMFCMSVLHEIGHYHTYDNVADEDIDFSEDEEERINAELADNESDDLYSEYFALPSEIVATEWAIDWIKKHPKKFKKLCVKVEKILYNFYKDNDVTGVYC